MPYNLDLIKRKISDLSSGIKFDSLEKKNRPKLTYFKPQLNRDGSNRQYEVRFVPYSDGNGQPFQEVSYYDNKQLSEYRFVAPAQFGMEDPLFDLLNELRKEGTKDSWRLLGTLRPRERYYAPVLVRGEEDKGIQVWELNSKQLKDIYSILAHPDYCNEDLMDAEKGYDFVVTASDSGQRFGEKKWVVKSYDIHPRRNPSPLASTKKERQQLLDSVPDLESHFKSQVRSADWIQQCIENFLSARKGANATDGTDHNASNGVGETDSTAAATRDIDEVFADLDDDSDSNEKTPF